MNSQTKIVISVIIVLVVLLAGIGLYFKYRNPAYNSIVIHEQDSTPADTVLVDGLVVEEEIEEEELEINYSKISFSIEVDSVTKVNDSVLIVHKSVHMPENAPCNYVSSWDEVKLINKLLERNINVATWDFIGYKPGTDNKQLLTEYCDSRSENEFSVTVEYVGNGLISIFYTNYFYGYGAAHGSRGFSTNNFSLQSGRKLNFHDLLKPQLLSVMDSLTIERLYKDYEMLKGYYSVGKFSEQLDNLDFTIGEKGIMIFFRGPNYVTSILEQTWTYEELRPYAKQDGLLQPFYNKIN